MLVNTNDHRARVSGIHSIPKVDITIRNISPENFTILKNYYALVFKIEANRPFILMTTTLGHSYMAGAV
jgi:hypothetical protein